MKHKNYLEADIKKIFKTELGVKIRNESKIYDYEKWDSLGNFNVLIKFEKKFKIKFSSSEFSKINTFKEILKVVKKKSKK